MENKLYKKIEFSFQFSFMMPGQNQKSNAFGEATNELYEVYLVIYLV